MHLYLFISAVQASCYHQVSALQVWSSFMQHQVSPAKLDLFYFYWFIAAFIFTSYKWQYYFLKVMEL